MQTLTIDKFTGGIDRRKGRVVSDADKLWYLKNAFITTGGSIQKRQGTVQEVELETGTAGLYAALGKLNTFYGPSSIAHSDSRFQANKIVNGAAALQPVTKIYGADVFNSAIYVSAGYANDTTYHHYLDGSSPTRITDVNCPHSTAIVKGASKIWAVAGSQVRFCATNDPRDWTTSSDAGFLPTDLQASGSQTMTALGLYRGNLVPFTDVDAQIWNIDPDPALHAFQEHVPNVGTCYPLSIVGVSGDLYVLSDFGFRSISLLALTQNLADIDVGSPIDGLVRPEIASDITVTGLYASRYGQYWCVVGGKVFVFSFSRTAKLAAWSLYDFPWDVDAITQQSGVIYLRSGDHVYSVDETAYTDAGTDFEVDIELPYLDFKKPGLQKQVVGADLVMTGTCDLQFRYDARDETKISPPVRVSGGTRGGGLIPVELMGTELAPRLVAKNNQDFRLDALSLYFNTLGAQ